MDLPTKSNEFFSKVVLVYAESGEISLLKKKGSLKRTFCYFKRSLGELSKA